MNDAVTDLLHQLGADHVTRPGCCLEPMKPVRTVDPEEQIERCLNCPYQTCKNPGVCRYRLNGTEKHFKAAPKGYDREAMRRVMPHVYTIKDLMNALDTTEYRARRYMEYYYEEAYPWEET